VEDIANRGDIQRVKLAGGQELFSRLVVLASGAIRGLQANLRMKRCVLQRDQSLVFGFTIATPESEPFNFDSVTYYSLDPSACIDYLTLFRIRQTMRANLFVFRSASDPWVREFIRAPDRMLRRYLPKLDRVIGEFQVIGKVESGGVDLYRVDGEPQPGVVPIGDAFQSVCPSTGMGLDKILTDVDVLSECVPSWMATSGMGVDKLADFYSHPRKVATDSQALYRAIYQRRAATDPSLRWRIHRFFTQVRRQLFSAIRCCAAKMGYVPEAGTRNQTVEIPARLERRTDSRD
jgi:2-polyprenyl-6-methoxyphenol hydroxylase-like FAD-dependent oxidoreductase